MYCKYYQAKVVKNRIWFIIGALKNEDHWAFVRTLEAKRDILEFFVAPDFEEEFLGFMKVFQKKKLVLALNSHPNRLLPKNASVFL